MTVMAQGMGATAELDARAEEIVVPKDLQGFLGDIVEKRGGFRLGDPWKFSEEALHIVVPIFRENTPRRRYTTLYEVKKDLGIKDSGSVDHLQLQNRTGQPVFVRAGTVFAGETQERAAANSGVYQDGKHEVPVKCVHQTRGLQGGAEMKFGTIAPMSVTMTLLAGGDQMDVWESVRRFTGGDKSVRRVQRSEPAYRDRVGVLCDFGETTDDSGQQHTHYLLSEAPHRRSSTSSHWSSATARSEGSSAVRCLADEPVHGGHYARQTAGVQGIRAVARTGPGITFSNGLHGDGTDDLFGHLQKVKDGQNLLNDMMQRVPLWEDQAGAIIFGPVGVLAVETFDSPISWAAIKKEIIETLGDKVSEKQAEHLFELKKEMIGPSLKKFITGLAKMREETVRKDEFSETRVVIGEGVVGEYTLVKNQVIHAILVRESAS